MTKHKIAEINMGENLDNLMNLDPRGYGVSRILYSKSRELAGEPLSMHAANFLVKNVTEGDIIYILTGFILWPHKVPEMDGLVSAVLLARSLIKAFDAKPIIICPIDCKKAVEKCSNVVGLHSYQELQVVMELPLSMGIVTFSKNVIEAKQQTEDLLSNYFPKTVISIEAPGANSEGEYHNAIGRNVSDMEAKTDILFEECMKRGVKTIAIGDLGNEMGMGELKEHIKRFIPYTDKGECCCPCKGGIVVKTKADYVITATVSDWGCYAMMAAVAYLKGNCSIFHNAEMEEEVMRMATKCGIIDMTGSLIPGIDGFDIKMNRTIVEMMRQCITFFEEQKGQFEHWYQGIEQKGYYADYKRLS